MFGKYVTTAHPFGAAAFVVALAAFLITPAAGQVGYRADAQGKDELWDITSKMEMAGMPFAMPGQTNRVCVVKGSEDEGIPKKDDCKVLESRRTGNKITYKMACKSGKSDYTASGGTSWSGNGYQGRMQIVGKMEGEQMDMTMTYAGTRAGNCTSTIKQDLAAMKAQSDKAVADVCREGLEKLQWQLFVGDGAVTCQGRKAEFCAAVQRAGQAMREPSQFIAMKPTGDSGSSPHTWYVDFSPKRISNTCWNQATGTLFFLSAYPPHRGQARPRKRSSRHPSNSPFTDQRAILCPCNAGA